MSYRLPPSIPTCPLPLPFLLSLYLFRLNNIYDQNFDSVINIFVIIIFIVVSPSVNINIPLLTFLFEKERKYKNIIVHSDKCLMMSRIL